MKQFDYTINTKMGIHARPAALIADRVKFMEETVRISFDGKSADALKIMEVIGLGARKGDTVTVSVEGPEEEKTAQVIEELFKENF